MKRIITILLLLVVVMSLAIGGIHAIGDSRSQMQNTLEEISDALQKQEDILAAEQTKSLSIYWEERGNLFGTYVKHELVDQIGREISRLHASIQTGEQEEAIALIAEIRYDLDRLYQNELPRIKNIL